MAPEPDVDATRRRVLGALAGLAAAAPFFAGDRTRRAGAITLRYTAHVPRSHGLYTKGFVPFARMVEEETGGRLRLEPCETGTRVAYDYEVHLAGKVAAVGGRMLQGAARVLIGQFLAALIRQCAGEDAPPSPGWWTRFLRAVGISR